jgi:hypothetical protein
MLSSSSNMALRDNILIRDGLRELRRRLPLGWSAGSPADIGNTTEITGPDRRRGSIRLETRAHLDPRGVRSLIDTTGQAPTREVLVVVAPYLSEGTRALLQAGDIGYIDLTGNARIVMSKPGLFIQTQGADKDPDRKQRTSRSLRGAKAGRIVRALLDRKEPPGVRELALLTKVDPGYISRVLAFLDTEALVTRVGHGRMQAVDWPSLLRRWAQEAPLESRGQARTFLEPRGFPALLNRLAKSEERYVVSGGLAAAAFAPNAPTRLATIWLRDAVDGAARLGLRPAEAGANVMLIEPGDDDVFEGAVQRDGVWYAAPSQVAVDLLTSPGRGPAEGEELISWMLANEEAWRR